MNGNIIKLRDRLYQYSEESSKNIDILENESMRLHTTFKIGGRAGMYVRPGDTDSLIHTVSAAEELGVRIFIMGNGSNLLFDDGGFDGVVISTEKMNSVMIDGEYLTAGAGAMLSSCAVSARDNALSGMECLYGIPGTVGGAVFMNAGAYGGEMKDIVIRTEYYDRAEKRIKTIEGDEHSFGYRESIFRHNEGVILSSTFKLKKDATEEINARMADYKGRRISKQPLEYPSAGSTFKRYPGRYTAQMIDEAGLKGLSVGGAQISEKHAGFVINRGGATSDDVLKLINTVKERIRELYGIDIECEVIYVSDHE